MVKGRNKFVDNVIIFLCIIILMELWHAIYLCISWFIFWHVWLIIHSFKYIDYPNFRYDTQWAFEKEIHCVLQYSQHVMSSFGLWSVFNCVLLFQGYSLKVKLNDCCYYYYTGMSSHNLLLLWYTPYIQTYYQ